MRELLKLPEPRWVVSPLTLTQVMVGRGSPWAAQVIATSWPVSATTSWGGWRNTGITVRHRGKKSYKQKKTQRKTSLCAELLTVESTELLGSFCCSKGSSKSVRRCTVSIPTPGPPSFTSISLLSTPVCLCLVQLYWNVLGSLSFKNFY